MQGSYLNHAKSCEITAVVVILSQTVPAADFKRNNAATSFIYRNHSSPLKSAKLVSGGASLVDTLSLTIRRGDIGPQQSSLPIKIVIGDDIYEGIINLN